MRTKLVWGAFVFGLGTAVLVLAGCGRHRPVAGETQAQDASAEAQGLRLKVLGADSRDPLYPDRSADAKDANERKSVVISGNEITYLTPFQFTDPPKPLYLAWNQEAFESPIRTARYEYVKETPTGQTLSSPQAHLAERDQDTGRWFIPMAEVLPARVQEYDPSIYVHLKLDLVLANGRQIWLGVRFRATGPLPTLLPSAASVTAYSGNPLAYAQSVSRNGAILLTEQYANPTSRTLIFWVRSGNLGELHLKSQLTIGRYDRYNTNPPRPPKLWTFDSVAGFRLASIVVHGTSEKSFTLPQNQWVALPVSPNSSVTVDWVAQPQTAQFCQIPAPETQVYEWENYTEPHPPHPGREFKDANFLISSRAVVVPWQFTAATITGTWDREVRLSDTIEANPDVSQQENWPRVVALAANRFNTSQGGGAAPGAYAGNWSCNGLY